MFGAGVGVFHHSASRDLPWPVLHEQHVFGVLVGLGFFWGGQGGFGRWLVLSFVVFVGFFFFNSLSYTCFDTHWQA